MSLISLRSFLFLALFTVGCAVQAVAADPFEIKAGDRVVVIGDTPHDVAAAHAIEAQCMAVATGGFSIEQLKEAGADWAYENLAAPGAIDVMLDG